MFTGIITDIGTLRAVEQRGDLRARIGTGYAVAGIDLGASIACDGVCLTVVAFLNTLWHVASIWAVVQRSPRFKTGVMQFGVFVR